MVYDLFHVVARYGRKVIDRVVPSVDEANRRRHDRSRRRGVEGINNTTKVIKRHAYGSRGLEYLFPKIRPSAPEFRDEPFW